MAAYESGYDPKYGYNKNAFEHKTLPQAIFGKVVQLITTPIGLVSEAVHSHKDKKKAAGAGEKDAAPGPETQTTDTKAAATQDAETAEEATFVELPPDQADDLIAKGQAVPAPPGRAPTHELVAEDDADHEADLDEQDWALDEVIGYEEGDDDLSTVATQDSQPPAYEKTGQQKLPFPVILPQRRPGSKSRGFVRAYAPVLADSGLDQTTFLKFLKDLHSHAQASPIFEVAMIGTALVGLYPEWIIGLSAQAMQIVALVGQEVQERWRMNKFLEQANKDIFAPKGLYAMVVTYKRSDPNQPLIGTTTVDLSQELGATAVAKYGKALTEGDRGEASKTEEWKEKMKRLRVSSGQTTEAEFPLMTAPLIFPALEKAQAKLEKAEGKDGKSASTIDATTAKIKARAKGANAFVADYFDRRAQLRYAFQNPESSLVGMNPTREFKSKIADPNDARNKHLFTLLTGGRYKAEPLGARRRWERHQRKEAAARAQGLKVTPKKRILEEDVIYLMVVNMPTEAELEVARKKLADLKAEKEAGKA